MSGADVKITAAIPVKAYYEPFLRACLQSLLGQSSGAWRGIIVVEHDDVDHFRTLLAAELEDPRLSLIVNTGRKLAGAVNTAIRSAETEFVAILLGDDMWDLSAVAVLTAAIEAEPGVDFFHSARRAVDDDGRPCNDEIYPAQDDVRREAFIYASQVKHLLCFRREMALRVGGVDETINSVGPDDYDFPWTMADHGAKFRAVQDCLYVYRDHRRAFRLTTHLPKSVHTRELVRILRKHGTPWPTTIRRVHRARRGYLKQCIYRTRLHKWWVEAFGWPKPKVWREYG